MDVYLDNPRVVSYASYLYPAVQRQHNGRVGPLVAIILILRGIEIQPSNPITVPDLGIPKGGAQLGQRVKSDCPVTEDAGLSHLGEQEDLLNARSRSRRRAGRPGEDGAQAEGEDELGAAGSFGGIGGDLDEVEDLGSRRSDV